MKPRFSILTLLGITAYVAISFAGVLSKTWFFIASGVWSIAMLALFALAIRERSAQVIFARGFVCGGMLFVLLFIGNLDFAEELLRFIRNIVDDSTNVAINSRATESLIIQSVATLLGTAIGTTALWRYRVLERREQQRTTGVPARNTDVT